MGFTPLEIMVKDNVQKNNNSVVEVSMFSKRDIKKYKNLTNDNLEEKFSEHIRCPFKFRNYSKIIDKLDDCDLYFEIASKDGFSLLEFNGIFFKSIEYIGDNQMNSLKKYESLNQLNKEYNDWLDNRHKERASIMTKADNLERKYIQTILSKKSNKSKAEKTEDVNL